MTPDKEHKEHPDPFLTWHSHNGTDTVKQRDKYLEEETVCNGTGFVMSKPTWQSQNGTDTAQMDTHEENS